MGLLVYFVILDVQSHRKVVDIVGFVCHLQGLEAARETGSFPTVAFADYNVERIFQATCRLWRETT